MPTGADELQYTTITRIAGQTENVGLDVETSCGKNRAFADIVERADSLTNGALTVSTTALALRVGASNLTNRKGILIQNLGSSSIFVGSSSVTTANGIEVGSHSSIFFKFSETQTIYGISTAAQNVRVMEIS